MAFSAYLAFCDNILYLPSRVCSGRLPVKRNFTGIFLIKIVSHQIFVYFAGRHVLESVGGFARHGALARWRQAQALKTERR
jgi:hypothetical protein